MEKNRAKEIAASPKMVNVTYDGTPIYIERVNFDKNTADIHPLNAPGQKREVLIEGLKEQ